MVDPKVSLHLFANPNSPSIPFKTSDILFQVFSSSWWIMQIMLYFNAKYGSRLLCTNKGDLEGSKGVFYITSLHLQLLML